MDVVTQLEARGIQPSPQRVAVAQTVLRTGAHSTAEQAELSQFQVQELAVALRGTRIAKKIS